MQTNAIEAAVTALKNNEIIGLPTETVYGLAGSAFSEIAVEKIFALKNRPHFSRCFLAWPANTGFRKTRSHTGLSYRRQKYSWC
jgi:L-threonylcarbamoyladenylate synthase